MFRAICSANAIAKNTSICGNSNEIDAASVTALRICQLDFWTETSLEVQQDNFNGGCNFLGNSEFSLGLGAVLGNQEDQSLVALGYKHILQDFTENSTGFGLAASREWGRLKFNDESSQETLFTTIAPVSLHGTDFLQVDASYGSDYGTFQEARAFTIGFGITSGY